MRQLYGLRVRSELPLDAPTCRGGRPDLSVSWGAPAVAAPSGEPARVLADAAWGQSQGYTHTETPDGYTLRFHGVCEMQLDRDRRHLRVHPLSGADAGLAAVLVTGNALAFLLTLAGECVLHASAVSLDGRALAFVGGPGMGKSTLAALCGAAGARVVTDDVLRLAPDGAGFRCIPGTLRLRLRTGAADLGAWLPGADARPTPDGRVAVRLGEGRRGTPRLRAIVVPHSSRDHNALHLERLTGARALLALLRHPRVLGLRDRQLRRSQFEAFARVARSVPVYEAQIPWGPPFDPDLADALLTAVGIAPRAARIPA